MSRFIIIEVVEAAPAGGGGAGCAMLIMAACAWACCGNMILNAGILIPGFDIEDYSPEEHWMPPWLDLWPDARHGIFISGKERACYAEGYDFSDCPSDIRSKLQEERATEAAEKAAAEAVEYVTMGQTCNIRPDASTDNSPVGKVAKGDRCEVVWRSGGWTQVDCDGTRGWVGKVCLD